jgi:hypothetical protein
MSSKLALSLAAALALSVASGVARADPTSDEVDAAETELPASVKNANRAASKHSPTNDEVDAAEAESPDSPDEKNKPPVSDDGKSNSAWRKSESDNPHSTDHD